MSTFPYTFPRPPRTRLEAGTFDRRQALPSLQDLPKAAEGTTLAELARRTIHEVRLMGPAASL